MEKIIDIIESIANEKNLPIEEVSKRVQQAIINTAKKLFGEEKNFNVDISKNLCVYQTLTVTNDSEEANADEFIKLSAAKQISPDLEVGDMLNYEISFADLDRTAVNYLYKELEANIQALVEEKILEKYQALEGKLVYGPVLYVDAEENTFIELDEVRAILPRKYRIKGEKFKQGDVVRAIVRKASADNRGLKISLSRTSPMFLNALLHLEVPEIKDGMVEIVSSARIPGERAKVLLRSLSPSIDPVGATVGVKGVRVNAISAELNGENIDCIEYSNEQALIISRALAPAIISSVSIEDQTAKVLINSEQKNKAIGKQGINIRLCAMLTGLQIELIEQNSSETSQISAEVARENLENLFKNI